MRFAYIIIYFIIWPFAALVEAIKNIRIKKYRIFFLFFFCLLAYYIIPYGEGDIRLYEKSVEIYSQFGLDAFFLDIYLSIIGEGSRGFEIFIPINSYLTSLFGSNVRISFVLTAILYYIFWISIVIKLIKEYDLSNNSKNRKALLLLFTFSIYIIFYRVLNGRFYLAYWGALYGAYMVINEKKNNFLLLTLSTILIHQAFIFFNAILLVHIFFHRFYNNKSGEIVLFGLILIGAIMNQVGVKLVSDNLSFLTDDVSEQFMAYTKDSYIEKHTERIDTRVWFQTLRGPLLFYSTALFLLIIRFTKKNFFEIDKNLKSWYFFILFFWALNSLTFEVPQFGDRFRNVLIGFMILFLFKVYNSFSSKKYNLFLYIFLIAFTFYKIVTIRVFAEYINVYTFTPVPWLFNIFDDSFSLYKLIN